MPEGTVHDLYTGLPIGPTDDIDGTFLAAVETAAAKEACYVVLGSGTPDGFADRVREICPTVEDPSLEDAALIVAGDPAEWEPLTPA